jgi:4-amino-4-deoxy-L-arabinose transferase-like glycosyltransferase
MSLGVLGLALLVRLVHVWSISDAPFFPLRMGDAADHHQLGQEMAAGEWLGRGVFFHAPLYPYFLGVVYSVLGSGALEVRLVQTILGALSAVFVAQAANRLFGWRVGVTAGVLLALYAPAVYYDTVFQDSVLDLFFGSLTLWMLTEAVVRPGRAHLFATGLALGLFQLSRENATILLFPILAWVALRQDLKPRGRAAAAATLILGFATALAPLLVRNALTSGDLLPGRRLQLGINLYIGNNPEADGYYRPLRAGRGNPRFEMEDAIAVAEEAEGRKLNLAEVSDHWIDKTIDYVVREPLDWLGLMVRKTGLALNVVEASDTEDLYTYADHSPILDFTRLVLNFGVLFALAVFGTWMTWPRRRELALFYALAAIYMVGILVFFVFGRYRHPVTPFLVLLAAAGLAGLPQFLRERDRRQVGASLAVTVGLLVVSHRTWGRFSRSRVTSRRRRSSTCEPWRSTRVVPRPINSWEASCTVSEVPIRAFRTWSVVCRKTRPIPVSETITGSLSPRSVGRTRPWSSSGGPSSWIPCTQKHTPTRDGWCFGPRLTRAKPPSISASPWTGPRTTSRCVSSSWCLSSSVETWTGVSTTLLRSSRSRAPSARPRSFWPPRGSWQPVERLRAECRK